MDPIIRDVRPALPEADPALLTEARVVAPTRAEHDRLTDALPCLASIAVRPPEGPVPAVPSSLRVVAWNAERCKFAEASAAMLRAVTPDIVLLTEMDVGMVRSGNRDTVADLAAALGLGWGFAVEFLELGLGDDQETVRYAGETNAKSWHGNAILSRWPLQDWTCVRLDDGGYWFDLPDGQRRLGARMAVTARLETPGGPVRLVSVHLENRSTPEVRAEQMARLVAAIPDTDARVVIGGDWNTSGMPRGALPPHLLREPQTIEPLFARLGEAGFAWSEANTAKTTQRTRPDGAPAPPFRRIDWFALRGLDARDPATIAAVGPDGSALSDHEALAVTIDAHPAAPDRGGRIVTRA